VDSSGRNSSRSQQAATDAPVASSIASASAFDKLIASQSATSVRRLFAGEQYFGLEARAFCAGAERLLPRVTAHPSKQPRVDVHGVGEAFHLDATASWTLIRGLLAGGLLYPDGTGGYCPTERFHEYALACVVAPLSRARAKGLIDTACELATRINADWTRNPFQIKSIAVSGSYMSCSNTLRELSLWVVLRRRRESQIRGRTPSLNKGDALRQIVSSMNGRSSFIAVGIAPEMQAVPRPFSVVFQASDEMMKSPAPTWDRVRDWSASIARRIGSR
jgi:hypothetical protein